MGYDDSENSWEPAENIEENCKPLIARFWEHIGHDNEDYLPGYECRAEEAWIKEEMARFHKDNKTTSKKKSKRKLSVVKAESPSDDEAILRPPKKKRVGNSTETEDDAPLKLKTSISKKGKQKAIALPKEKNKESVKAETGPSLFSDDDVTISPDNSPAKPASTTASTSKPVVGKRKPPPLVIPSKQGSGNVPKSAGAPPSAKSASRSATNTPIISSTTPGFLKPTRKIHPVPDESTVASGSNLSVKNRLSAHAMLPTLPKSKDKEKAGDALRRTNTAPIPKKPIGLTIGFKKKPPSLSVNPTITDEDMAPKIPTFSPNVPAHSPTSTTPLNSPPHPALDTTMTSLNGAPSPTLLQGEISRITDRPMAMSPIAHDQDMGDDAANLFNDSHRVDEDLDPVQRAPMAAPLERPIEQQDQSDELVTPARTSLATGLSSTQSFPGRIQKKWKWTGSVLMQSSSEPQMLCQATLFDAEQLQQNGMPLRVALPDERDLVFHKYLSLELLEDILVACNPMEAAASLKAKDDDDLEAIERWTGYLKYHNQVAMSRVELDGVYAGNIIVAPSDAQALMQRLNVSANLLNNKSPLVAVLLTWSLSRDVRSADWRSPFKERLRLAEQMKAVDTEQDPEFQGTVWDEGTQERNTKTKMAIRILRFPKWLHDHMLSGERTYCVWPPPEQRDVVTELEVQHLTTILAKYPLAQCRDLTEPNMRVVFIHARAQGTIEKIQYLNEWRAKRIETMFVVFGSCSTTSYGSDWRRGFWEIYPIDDPKRVSEIGGVLTFTAGVLLSNPCELYRKVQQIAHHPLWTGYIVPSVLGMAVKLAYKDRCGDPLEDFDKGNFPFLFLLNAVEDGHFSLMRAPPSPEDHQALTTQWLDAQIDHVTRDSRETLGFCLNEFLRSYGNVPEERWERVLEEEISDDLRKMQIQPKVMEDYRRFVVLCDEEKEDTLHGLEWTTPTLFEFQDNLDRGTPPPDSPLW
ncbi:hypothetical protein VNI00_004860 [Paramarasmius palmivorus]|uniref:Chromo domain-containing protein n=1 Tax=Paramarasmius palmivorus TaxID=297713 RepID=A0AAW0DHX2_9AGAR